MSLLDALAAASSFDAAQLTPLMLDNHRIGWIRTEMAPHLRGWPEVFDCRGDRIDLLPSTPLARTAALGTVTQALAAAGHLRGWRGERYTIAASVTGAELFALERAAVRAFGVGARAAHLNGYVRDGAGWSMWIARRSPGKPIDPGMLDNLVGGGIAEGMVARQTLVKECAEEAGIAAGLAAAASAAGRLRVRRLVPDGVQDETLHCFDLELPADFLPINHDGEVAEFRLVSPHTLVDLLAARELTVDAGVVAIDFLERHGALPPEPGLWQTLAELRVPDHGRGMG